MSHVHQHDVISWINCDGIGDCNVNMMLSVYSCVLAVVGHRLTTKDFFYRQISSYQRGVVDHTVGQ